MRHPYMLSFKKTSVPVGRLDIYVYINICMYLNLLSTQYTHIRTFWFAFVFLWAIDAVSIHWMKIDILWIKIKFYNSHFPICLILFNLYCLQGLCLCRHISTCVIKYLCVSVCAFTKGKFIIQRWYPYICIYMSVFIIHSNNNRFCVWRAKDTAPKRSSDRKFGMVSRERKWKRQNTLSFHSFIIAIRILWFREIG